MTEETTPGGTNVLERVEGVSDEEIGTTTPYSELTNKWELDPSQEYHDIPNDVERRLLNIYTVRLTDRTFILSRLDDADHISAYIEGAWLVTTSKNQVRYYPQTRVLSLRSEQKYYVRKKSFAKFFPDEIPF